MVGALGAHSHGTDSQVADLAWRIFLVATYGITAKRVNRSILLVAATIAAVAAAGDFAWIGFAAIGLAVVGSSDLARVGSGLLIGAAMLHAGWPGGTGHTAVLAAVILLALVAGRGRRFAGRAALVGLGLAVASGAAVGLAALALAGQRTAAQQAVDRGQAGLDAARLGQSDEAAANFALAKGQIDNVLGTLGGWFTLPARSVPVVGANLGDARTLLEVARSIAASGVTTARAADIDRIAPRDGAVDLAALRSFGRPLQSLDATLTRARRSLASAGSTWTIQPLLRRVDDLDERVTRAQRDARRARRAVAAVPELLGGSGARRYFLAVMTPSELRGGGGFVGNWGILEAMDGKVSLPRFGRIADLYRDEPYRIEVSPEYQRRYVDYFKLETFPQNILTSPDLPSNAVAIRQILQQAGEGDVDGIIAIDPIAIAALLRLTGPIDVAGWGEPLDSANVAEILLHRQYEDADDPGRPELLARTTQALFQRLTTGALPSAAAMAQTVGSAVEAGHLQFASLHDVDHAVLDDAGLQHPLRPPSDGGMFVITQNEAPSKLDWFLRRSITYDLHVNRDGEATGTVTVELRNTAPTTGLPATYYQYAAGGLARGANAQDVSVYTPFRATGVAIEGRPVEYNTWTEKGWNIYDRFLVVPPGESRTATFRLVGAVDGGTYRIDIPVQPTVAPDHLKVVLNRVTLQDGELTAPLKLVAPLP